MVARSYPGAMSWRALAALLAPGLFLGAGPLLPSPTNRGAVISADVLVPPHPAEQSVSDAEGGAPVMVFPDLPLARETRPPTHHEARGITLAPGQAPQAHRHHPITVRTARAPPR